MGKSFKSKEAREMIQAFESTITEIKIPKIYAMITTGTF